MEKCGQDARFLIFAIRDGRKKGCVDPHAKVAELVDALDLGSSGATRAGSSPAFRTMERGALRPGMALFDTDGSQRRPKQIRFRWQPHQSNAQCDPRSSISHASISGKS